MEPTFRERYCRRHGLAPEAFPRHLLPRALYPHARPLAALLGWLDRQHFQADHEFIEDVGHMRRLADFPEAARNYADHFSNGGFLRRTLRLRVSVRRMWLIVAGVRAEEVPLPAGADSLTPFQEQSPPSHREPRAADDPVT
jgi:hypothetical protein